MFLKFFYLVALSNFVFFNFREHSLFFIWGNQKSMKILFSLSHKWSQTGGKYFKEQIQKKELKKFFLLIFELIFKLPTDKLLNPLNLAYWSILEEKSLKYLLWEYKEYNWKRQEKISIFIFNSEFFLRKIFLHCLVTDHYSCFFTIDLNFLFCLVKLGVEFLRQFFCHF